MLLAGIAATTATGHTQDSVPTAPPAQRSRILDAAIAQGLGFSSRWQSRLPVLQGMSLQGVRLVAKPAGSAAGKDELFAWDSSGVILCIDSQTGELDWQSAAVARTHGFLDVQAAKLESDRFVVAFGDAACLVLDSRIGSEVGLGPYRRLPSTAAACQGNTFIYGSRAGQVVWAQLHDEHIPSQTKIPSQEGSKGTSIAGIHIVLSDIRSQQLDGSISVPPLIHGNSVIACSSKGEVASYDFRDATRLWKVQLNAPISASPGIQGTLLFVGSHDQYLRCMDVVTGKTKWKWFNESPLTRAPLAADDLVLIQSPGAGMLALETAPKVDVVDPVTGKNTPGTEPNRDGAIRWRNAAVTGDAILRHQEGVVVWDADARTLWLLDEQSGLIRRTVSLPDVVMVKGSELSGGTLLLLSNDGRMQLLSALLPLKPMTESPPPAPKAPPVESSDSVTE